MPEDVAVALEITVHNGIVKIFDEETEINPVNFRYFSDMTEDTQNGCVLNSILKQEMLRW